MGAEALAAIARMPGQDMGGSRNVVRLIGAGTSSLGR